MDRNMNAGLSKREVLVMGGAVGATVAANPLGALAATASPPNRLHIFANPFDKMPPAVGAALAAEAGYGGIDMTVRRGDLIEPERVEDDLPKAVEAVKAAGLRAEMITTAITDPRDPVTEKILRTASRLGIKYYRFGNYAYDKYPSTQEALKQLKPIFSDLAAMNRQFGLRGAIQNHAGRALSGSVWDLFYLIQDMDPQLIGCHYDVRHAVVEGTSSWRSGYDMIAPWIHVLIPKDFRWTATNGQARPQNTAVGEGIVDMKYFFERAKQHRFSGPLSVHFAYGVFNSNTWDTPQGRAEMLALLRKDLEALRPNLVVAGLAPGVA